VCRSWFVCFAQRALCTALMLVICVLFVVDVVVWFYPSSLYSTFVKTVVKFLDCMEF